MQVGDLTAGLPEVAIKKKKIVVSVSDFHVISKEANLGDILLVTIISRQGALPKPWLQKITVWFRM